MSQLQIETAYCLHPQKYELERSTLQSLPHYRTADYEILSSRVSVHSTISVRCILYSIPSRLIPVKFVATSARSRYCWLSGNRINASTIRTKRNPVESDDPIEITSI